MAEPGAEKRRSIHRMVGDFLREAAVLVIVFYPLDQYFNYLHPERVTNTIPVRHIVGLSLLLLVGGMLLERIDFGAVALRILNVVLRHLMAVKERWEGEQE